MELCNRQIQWQNPITGEIVSRWATLSKPWMPITSSTAGDWCKKIGEMIDEPTLHPHDFRHSGATLLKNAGMSLEDVSSLLNHAGTDVTNKYYTKKDTTKIQSAKDRFEI